MLDLVARILKNDRTVVFAYLFGSRAKQYQHSQSDWDIAVFLDPPPKDGPHGKKYLDLYLKISKELRTDSVDVVILNCATPSLAKAALTGKRLFCRNTAKYVRYFVQLMHDLDDQMYLVDAYVPALKKRLNERTGRGRPSTRH
ncbi:MAG TPA: nucleotidyltransferase domain-containing protein [Bdellovibrionota bacterium]|nr:nucleotidyltransferase domain-containing protein [Bdellovibrionota bacterium]